MTFTIPYPFTKAERKRWSSEYGLNSIYAGKHWTKRKKDSEFWHWLVKAELTKQKLPSQPFDVPVKISFAWNDNLDCSNHAYMAKMIEDSIKGYLIKDDNRLHVKAITHEFHDEPYIKVDIRPLA